MKLDPKNPRTFLLCGLLLAPALAGACNQKDGPAGAATTASAGGKAGPGAKASAAATASATATAGPVALADRFAGPPPEGTKRSGQRLGIPKGWEAGSFGEVKTGKKDGYAALYDLPQFPPKLSQVELRTKSMGCKSAKLEPPVDGGVGTKKVPAKIHEGTCTFDGAPAKIWAIAVNIDKNDNPKVIVVAVKDSALQDLEKAVPTIVQGYADAW